MMEILLKLLRDVAGSDDANLHKPMIPTVMFEIKIKIRMFQKCKMERIGLNSVM